MWETEEHWYNRVECRTKDGFRVSIHRIDYIEGVDPISDELLPGKYAVNLTLGPTLIWVDEVQCDGSKSLTHGRIKETAWRKVLEHAVSEVMVS